MVQDLDTRQVVILAEDLEADRARRDERCDAVLAEQVCIVFHHLARRIGLAGQFERPAAADAAFAVGPPDLLARGLEDRRHRRHRARRQQGHAARKIAHLARTFGAVETLEIAVAAFVGHVVHLVARVDAERVEINADGAFLGTAAAHQAVVGRLEAQHVVTAVAQEVDRLHVVDAQHALQLAGVDADAAARAGLDLEIIVGRLLFARAQVVTAQEDEGYLRENMHVTRERQRHEEHAEARGIEPPRRGFEIHQRHHADMPGHPLPEAPGEESPAAVKRARGAFGHQTRREHEPQRRQGHPVARDVLRRAPHAHRPGVETLAPGQRHAREDEQQQEVHREIEERLVLQPRGEILEKDVSLQRHVAEAQIGDRLGPPHGDQQEPAESQRHVHVPQQGVDPEDAAVEQRLAHHLPRRPEGAARRQSEQNPFLVGAGQAVEPRPPLPGQDGEHHRSADDERQTEWRVESHRQKSPSLRLISITTPRVLMPRGHTSRHLPHSMHLFISS